MRERRGRLPDALRGFARLMLGSALGSAWCVAITGSAITPSTPTGFREVGDASWGAAVTSAALLVLLAAATVEMGSHETARARATGVGSLVGLVLGAAYCFLSAAMWTSTEVSTRFDATRFPGSHSLWQGAIMAPAIMGAIAVFLALSASIDLARWPRSVCRAVGTAGPAAVGVGTLWIRVGLAPS